MILTCLKVCFTLGRGWFDGDLNRLGITAGETSSVTAFQSDWEATPPIHEVYYQAEDGNIRAIVYTPSNNTWSAPNHIFEEVPWGADIAITYIPGFGRRLYTNDALGKIMEIKNDGNQWYYTERMHSFTKALGRTHEIRCLAVTNTQNHEIGAGISVANDTKFIYVLAVTSGGFLEGYQQDISDPATRREAIPMNKIDVFYLSSVTCEVITTSGFAAFQGPDGNLLEYHFNVGVKHSA